MKWRKVSEKSRKLSVITSECVQEENNVQI